MHIYKEMLSFAKDETNTIAMDYFNNTNNIIPGLVPLSIGLKNKINLAAAKISVAWESSNTKQFIDSVVNWFSRNIKLW